MAFFLLTAAASPFPSCLQRHRRASWLLHAHPPLHHACQACSSADIPSAAAGRPPHHRVSAPRRLTKSAMWRSTHGSSRPMRGSAGGAPPSPEPLHLAS
jgi:hypothetical protein